MKTVHPITCRELLFEFSIIMFIIKVKKQSYSILKQGLKPSILILFLVLNFVSYSQTNPVLEFAAGAGNPTGNGPTATTTITFQNNSNNPSGNTFATYTPALNVTFTLSNQKYDYSGVASSNECVFFGYDLNGSALKGTAIYQLMNLKGGPSDADFTSSGSSIGTGITVAANSCVETMIVVTPLSSTTYLTNSRVQMADVTFTFSRAVNNPIFQVAGLGGNYGSLAYTGEFDYVSSNVPVTFSKLSGSSILNVTSSQILNSSSAPAASGINSGRGSVLFSGIGITSLTLRLYIRGNGGGGTSPSNWSDNNGGGDAFTIGFSVSESDLAIAQTINNCTPKVGDNVIFHLTATNNGLSNNTSVRVNDLLPSGYTFVSKAPSSGTTYDNSTGVWTIGNLNSGASATLDITATILASGSYTNTASITGYENDPVSTNNSASVLPSVVNPSSAVSAICQGGTTAALGGSFGGGATSAVWSDGGAGGTFMNNSGSTPNTTTYTASATAPTSVTLTLTTSGGCGNAVANKMLTVNSLPTASIAGTVSVCQNSASPNITFTGANGTIPYTFTYKINSGSNQTVSTTSGSSVTIAQPTSTVGTFLYTLVSVKDASSTTCSNNQTGTATITVNSLPTYTFTHTEVSCYGGDDGKIVVTASGGSGSYEYSIDNGSTYSTSNTFSGLKAGNYQIKVRDTNECISDL